MTTVRYLGGLGGLGVLTQKILKMYSSNGAICGISEQNFKAILARSGAHTQQTWSALTPPIVQDSY